MKSIHTIIYAVGVLARTDFRYIALLASSTLFRAVLPFFSIYLTRNIVNDVVAYNNPDDAAVLLCVVLVTIVVLRICDAIVMWFRSNHYVLLGHQYDLKNAIKTICLDYAKLENPKYQDMCMRAAKGCSAIAREGEYVSDILSAVIQLLGVAMIIIQFNSWVAFVLLPLSYVSFLFAGKTKKRVVANENKNIVNERKIDYHLQLITRSTAHRDMRVYRAEEFMLDKYREIENDSCAIKTDNHKLSFAEKCFNILIVTVQMIIFYIVAVRRFEAGDMLAGDITLFVGTMTVSSNAFLAIFTNLALISATNMRIHDFQDYQSLGEAEDGEIPICKDGGVEIVFDNVSFRYPGAPRNALSNVSCIIPRYGKIAVIGENGSGKTTFVKLLLRLYQPTDGTIYVNGVNYLEYSGREYMDIMSCVFQDFKLFAFTVRENLTFNSGLGDDEIDAVRDTWDLRGLIDKLPKGLDTFITQEFDAGGVDLSGGEKQKIAIARACLKDSAMIILDEPTAALDPVAEATFYEKLLNTADKKSVVLISHRLSSTHLCDAIFYFSGGRIIERGSHTALLKRRGEYEKLYRAQAKWYV